MTKDTAIALRAAQHQAGFETLGFVRFAGNNGIRIAVDCEGRVFDASRSEQFGWSRWRRANTHSFDRYVRRVMA